MRLIRVRIQRNRLSPDESEFEFSRLLPFLPDQDEASRHVELTFESSQRKPCFLSRQNLEAVMNGNLFFTLSLMGLTLFRGIPSASKEDQETWPWEGGCLPAKCPRNTPVTVFFKVIYYLKKSFAPQKLCIDKFVQLGRIF